VLLAAIAAVTERIGLIATASTTYNEPYSLARRFASIDHISGGRAGWNVVTTAGDAAARNFSRAEQPTHSERYERAPESLALDRELPADLPPEDEIEGAKSRYTLIVNLARRERLTVRRLIGRLGGGRGHRTFSGTPEQVADAIQDWFQAGAADGFNIMPPVLPSGLDIFVDQVVPILQRPGLFRSEYTGSTLREHYGLAKPANSFARAPQPA
jgi:alkanesulfonate monooxygenase SsuD/methylene tetrahydromethanopterin reductase-like flavin-dependent oxidoreductase (luciferase family)